MYVCVCIQPPKRKSKKRSRPAAAAMLSSVEELVPDEQVDELKSTYQQALNRSGQGRVCSR